MKHTPIIIILLFPLFIIGEGFIAGTLVKTLLGDKPIEHIKPGEMVINYNNDQSYGEYPVIAMIKQKKDSLLYITINNTHTIITSPAQKFYLLEDKKWVQAKDLRIGNKLKSYVNNHAYITNILYKYENTVLYDIALEKYHNFCIGPLGINVHNFVITIPILTWIFGEGVCLVDGSIIGNYSKHYWRPNYKVMRQKSWGFC